MTPAAVIICSGSRSARFPTRISSSLGRRRSCSTFPARSADMRWPGAHRRRRRIRRKRSIACSASWRRISGINRSTRASWRRSRTRRRWCWSGNIVIARTRRRSSSRWRARWGSTGSSRCCPRTTSGGSRRAWCPSLRPPIAYVPEQPGLAAQPIDNTVDALDVGNLRWDDHGASSLLLDPKSGEFRWLGIPSKALPMSGSTSNSSPSTRPARRS